VTFDPLRAAVKNLIAKTLRVGKTGRSMGPMTNLLRALVVALVLSLVGLPACKTTGGVGGIGARIVDCAQQAIRDKGLLYVGKVNSILGGTELGEDDAQARLIELGIDAGQDVLGCLLRDQGAKFAESAQANPNDRVSVTAARRANLRLRDLEAEGWQFR
jgi:hypothetical protein